MTTRPQHPRNRQLANISGGLQRAVRGREDVIRTNATRLARRVDTRTKGRHRQKLTAALTALDFIIDRAGNPRADAVRSADAFRGRERTRNTQSESKPSTRRDDPEDLGELRDVSL